MLFFGSTNPFIRADSPDTNKVSISQPAHAIVMVIMVVVVVEVVVVVVLAASSIFVKFVKKFELMLTRHAKAYSSSGSVV